MNAKILRGINVESNQKMQMNDQGLKKYKTANIAHEQRQKDLGKKIDPAPPALRHPFVGHTTKNYSLNVS